LVQQLDKPEQQFVSLCLQIVDGARADLGVNAVDKFLLHFGCQRRLPENLPPGCHGPGELLEEVLDAALPAAEVVEKHVPHDAPTQAWPPGQCSVRVGSANDAFGNKIVNLPREGGLETIGDMPGQFLVQPGTGRRPLLLRSRRQKRRKEVP
jgi:hypothetical protein